MNKEKDYSSEFMQGTYCLLECFRAGGLTLEETQERIKAICSKERINEKLPADFKARLYTMKKEHSDGSTASYYDLPNLDGIERPQLIHLITYKNMNAQIGTIFEACYRYGQVAHSEKLRDAKKMKVYIDAEIERLEKYGDV